MGSIFITGDNFVVLFVIINKLIFQEGQFYPETGEFHTHYPRVTELLSSTEYGEELKWNLF